MKNKHIVSALLIGVALAAAGCSRRSDPEEVNAAENAQGVTVPLSEAPAEPAIVEANNSLEVPGLAAEAPLSDEEQMQEDAAATGMTSRLPSDLPGEAVNETAPAE